MKKIDLNYAHQRAENILENYDFDTLLLEISCNLPKITKETVREQFLTELDKKVKEAKEVFEENLDQIVNYALKEREE